jgi:branched-chain amino acid transport system substrate-binding protein
MKRQTLRAFALVTVVGTLLAACGSDDDAETSDASTEQPSDTSADDGAADTTAVTDDAATDTTADDAATDTTAAGGDSAPADGEPLQIGFVNQEEGSGSTFPDLREGAEAALAYVNDNGGVNGRPLEFVDCATNGSPEASQSGANEMIEAGVPIINGGIDYGSPAAIPILSSAGITYVPTLPTIAEEYGSPGVYTFFGGSAGQFAGQVGFIMDEYKPEKVGVLVINVPQGTSAAEGLVKAPLEAQGVSVNVVPADPNTADFTPSLTALTREDPDVITVLFTGPPCGQIMQAVGALAIDVPVLYPSGCIDKEYIEAGGTGAENAIFSTESLLPATHADDPQVELYLGAMEEYAGKSADEVTTYNQVSFISTYNLAEMLKRVTGDVTTESVTAALTEGGPYPSLMTPDYNCDGTALEGFPSLCGAPVRFVQYAGGEFTDISDWF